MRRKCSGDDYWNKFRYISDDVENPKCANNFIRKWVRSMGPIRECFKVVGIKREGSSFRSPDSSTGCSIRRIWGYIWITNLARQQALLSPLASFLRAANSFRSSSLLRMITRQHFRVVRTFSRWMFMSAPHIRGSRWHLFTRMRLVSLRSCACILHISFLHLLGTILLRVL